MTCLYTVSVDSIEGSTLRGRVHIINPDASFVPREPAFPLSLLVDAWRCLDNGFANGEGDEDGRGDRFCFTAEQGKDIAAGMRLKDEFSRLYELILGKHIRVTEDGYLLADDGRTVLEPRRKAEEAYLSGGIGHDGISHCVRTPGNDEEFSRRAADVVTSYDISPYRNLPLASEVAAVERPDEPRALDAPDGPVDLDSGVWEVLQHRSFAERPYAEIAVTVKDAGYLEHMVAGMRWSTAMWGV